MTTARTFTDDEGTFDDWQPTPQPCRTPGCEARVQVRLWESRDGAYEDAQYRCADGHTWWVDGIDS